MSAHSIAEAQNDLPNLIQRARSGEDVVITENGRPVAELRAVERAAQPITEADLDWLAARRIRNPIPTEDAGTLVSRMRDEEER